ncbi:MAG TPA: thioredoxin domain-containing protein [Candidatus Paceibacterota bacterium]|nr:thioredoxin domain-containing protein [Candidatus Paceibacterota bacterium]
MPEQEPVQSTSPAPAAAPLRPRSSLGIPIAIVVSALLIAGAIVYTGMNRPTTTAPVAGVNDPNATTPNPEPVTKNDHIRGNPNAPIVLIEYSDYDCPFCRLFHDTMTKVMSTYGADGKVAWVYRHFPLAQLHPNAPKISEAAYCVAELGGNDAFWKFTDALNDSRKVTYDANGQIQAIEPTDMTRMDEFAKAGGVDTAKFESCYTSGKYAGQVQEDVAAAMKAGARGTPYTVVVVGDQMSVINGAQPYESVKATLDTLLSQVGG